MANYDIVVDVSGANEFLNDVQKRQIPFAAAKALAGVAGDASKEIKKQLHKKTDRPTPFTIRGVGHTRFVNKNMRPMFSEVYFKQIQSEYLQWASFGGTRAPKKTANIVPEKVRLNKYGNIPKGKIKKLLKNKAKYFSGIPKGVKGAGPGIWERMGTKKKRKVRKIISYVGPIKYKKTFPFRLIVKKMVERRWPDRFVDELQAALRTAKR